MTLGPLGGRRSLGALAVAAVIAAACWPLAALADAASPWTPGDAIGEPTGAVAHVAITHEDLSFDLRRLADASPAQVHMTYFLRNDAASSSAELVFLADHAMTNGSAFTVTFDDAPVAASATTLTQLPDAWKPPTTTPALDGASSIPYATTPGTAFRFTVMITPGPHRLSVAYAVQPGRMAAPETTTIWQLAYILAPARQWASFGDLSVQTQLPAGWRARAIPALDRSHDTLAGHFVGVPANSMVISASFPVDAHVQTIPDWMSSHWPLFAALLGITIAGTAVLSWPTGRRWVLLPFGGLWALPAASVWMGTGYITPPATQYSTGKCGFVAAGCLLMPGAAIIAVIAVGLGVLAVLIPLSIGAVIWGRLRRPI
ncbi:MAG TPA: hypothetical protein VHK65_10620 [Candidatus Dormibacteraeota bacterium]|nr:hypothetical protein [Candidatus Dormibacteraeota bacterium]